MFLELGSVVLAISMATAAGLVGCFAVMRRMTLAADAISHVALPGVGIALLLHFQPVVGALAMLLFGTVLIWSMQERTGISTETIVGVVFSVALAIGSLITSGEELIDALFGAPAKLTGSETALGLLGAAVVVIFILKARHSLLVSLVSPDIALTAGINVARLNLLYLLAFALTVALGFRYLGVLLMGSLIIIPAATARRLARNLNHMLSISVAISVISTVMGSYAGSLLHRDTGPLIITGAGALFFLSLVKRQPQ
ncbi:metal ABC transporter permease [Candidatus Binatus sp.]|uniref:metal ABC transporter permease n=1 Tax=Candidatus Binatus sp. TaxID=2811406 RepID=UPI002F92D17D